MKLIKYIINLIILTGGVIFLKQLSDINKINLEKLTEGQDIMIQIPFLLDKSGNPQEFQVWVVILAMLTIGVLLGFFIALFQILSQKTELSSTRSKLKRLQIEVDNLRNESIDEDVDLSDADIIEDK